jgi:hypothetical protein
MEAKPMLATAFQLIILALACIGLANLRTEHLIGMGIVAIALAPMWL